MQYNDLQKSVLNLFSGPEAWESVMWKVWNYQFQHNKLYRSFCKHLQREPQHVKSINDIPFAPISLFKDHRVATGAWTEELVFKSSGTTGSQRSTHYIRSASFAQVISARIFEYHFGELSNYCILALLPSYLEQGDSSLVFMADHFIQKSKNPASGFYLHNMTELRKMLVRNRDAGQKTLLLGVSYALLDFIEEAPLSFPSLIVMETGGMKGRRREMTRTELHSKIKKGFGVPVVYSEYGMTELTSQIYSMGNGYFSMCGPIRAFIADLYDPLSFMSQGLVGTINIIDLANLHSCAFIATEDLGRLNTDGFLEVIGRKDASAIRGCNLLVTGK